MWIRQRCKLSDEGDRSVDRLRINSRQKKEAGIIGPSKVKEK